MYVIFKVVFIDVFLISDSLVRNREVHGHTKSNSVVQKSSFSVLPYVNELSTQSTKHTKVSDSCSQSNENFQASQELEVQYPIPRQNRKESAALLAGTNSNQTQSNAKNCLVSNKNQLHGVGILSHKHLPSSDDTSKSRDTGYEINESGSSGAIVEEGMKASAQTQKITVIEPRSSVTSKTKTSKTPARGGTETERTTGTDIDPSTKSKGQNITSTGPTSPSNNLFNDDGEDFSAPHVNFDSLFTPNKTKPGRTYSESTEASYKGNVSDTESEMFTFVPKKSNRKRNFTDAVEKLMDDNSDGETFTPSSNRVRSPVPKKSRPSVVGKIRNERKRSLQNTAVHSDSDTESNISERNKKQRISAAQTADTPPTRMDDTQPDVTTGVLKIKQEPSSK